MKMLVTNRKIILSMLVMIVLICGLGGVSYAQVCQVGDRLSPGESCTYPGTDIEFSVLANGSGRFLFFTAGTGINARNITINGVTYNFAATKQTDGKWLIEAAGAQTTPPPVQQEPDLVIQSFQSNKVTLTPGERFTLSATIENSGDGQASSTTLRYYRSSDATISSNDTEVGTDSVSALEANRTGAESISLTAPTSPGTYYYGVCVDSVTDESDTDNNCSTAASVTVTAPPNDEQPGGTTYSSGEEILTLPTGFWTPDVTSGGSFSIIGGNVTIELSNGGRIEEEGITYTCITGGGCTIEDGRVTRGTIQATGGDPPPQPAPQLDLADVNGDGTVNILDLVLIASSFGQTGETAADLNGDGVVNILDLVLAAGAIGNDAAAPALYTESIGMLTSAGSQTVAIPGTAVSAR